MRINQETNEAVRQYHLDGAVEIVRQLESNHNTAFQVKAGGRRYALIGFNRYMEADSLRVQLLFQELMREAGLKTTVPVCTRQGGTFAAVEGRLWALFNWCDGRPGKSDRFEDLCVLASTQGRWVSSFERLRSDSRLDEVIQHARKFRRRKSWAWVVPLDEVPRFAEEHKVFQEAEAEAPHGPHRKRFLDLLPEVRANVDRFDEILKEQGVTDLPRMVAHGNFHPTNMFISDRETVVFDFDCYSFELRIADFARAANWYHNKLDVSGRRLLFEKFQEHACLSGDEIKSLPLMMCAHDLYYAVGHMLLYLQEDEFDEHRRLIASIESEMKAPERYRDLHHAVLGAYLRNG